MIHHLLNQDERYLHIAAYGPQSSLENPRVPLQPVPDMAQGVEWAFKIPIRLTPAAKDDFLDL